MTPGTPSPSSMDMSGKAVTLRFAKTGLLATLAASAGAVALEAVVALAEALAPAEALALVEASVEASVGVEASVEATVDLGGLEDPEVSTLAVPPTHQTPSPTLLRQAVSPAISSTSATCPGRPAMRILSSCSPQSARFRVLRFSTSLTAVLAELVSSSLIRAQTLKLRLVCVRCP
jgi:hypothetical protein